MRVKHVTLLLGIFWNIAIITMESSGVRIICEESSSDSLDGPSEFYEDNSSSGITQVWDVEFPFRFATPWPVNESKLPATLYEMRVKREKIFARFQKKEVKKLKKVLKQEFKQAIEDHNVDRVREFEMHHQKIVLSAFESWAPTYRDTYYYSQGYGKRRSSVYSDRKDLLKAFLTISKDVELLQLAKDYQKMTVIKLRDEDRKPKKNQKKVISHTKSCNDQPKSYSLSHAQLCEKVKTKKELIKRLKHAIQENNAQIIKEFEIHHPQILYRQLINYIAGIQITFVSLEGASYTRDFTDQNKKRLQTALNAKINPNLLCPYNTFMLYEACDNHRMSFAKILCETPGINMNQQTHEGVTALLQFINRCYSIFETRNRKLDFSSFHETKEEIEKKVQNEANFVEYLLDKGADANLPDKNGTTPLMLATSHSCYSIMKLLLQKGANPHAKDVFGKNALDHHNGCSNDRTLGEDFFYRISNAANHDSRIEETLIKAMNKE